MGRRNLLLGQELKWHAMDDRIYGQTWKILSTNVTFPNKWGLSLIHKSKAYEPANPLVEVATYSPNEEIAYFFGTFNYHGKAYTSDDVILIPWDLLTPYAQWVSSFPTSHPYLSAYNAIQRISDELSAKGVLK